MKRITRSFGKSALGIAAMLIGLVTSWDAGAVKNLPKGYGVIFNDCQKYPDSSPSSDRTFCCENAGHTCTNGCGPLSSQECISACTDATKSCIDGKQVIEETIFPGSTGPGVMEVKPGRPGQPPQLAPVKRSDSAKEYKK